MCGIAGVAGRGHLDERDYASVDRATQAILSRGPDGLGTYPSREAGLSGGSQVYLAMRRLSIIDLQGGWQPLFNEDRSVLTVVNGEIYNHVELRAQLTARGHRLHTASDCEVLVHLYEEYGLDFVQHLRGMFAFALWDVRCGRLVLGRDRLGEKPLYIKEDAGRLWFASEMKSLLAAQATTPELDPLAVHSYLHYGWIPEPATMFASVRKLAPGHLLVVDVASWQIREHCYWRVEDVAPVQGDGVALVAEELETIGKLIVRADVPIGVALSGGFDSSLTAAMAARHSSQPVRTYSVGYAGSPAQDERQLAAVLARDLGLPFFSIEVRDEDMLDAFPSVAYLRDDPISDIAGYGYYALSERARDDGCPVLLQGQGVDELLWGYPWAVEAARQTQRRRQGSRVGFLEALWSQMPRRLSRPDLTRAAYLLTGALVPWRSLVPQERGHAMDLIAHDLTPTYQIGAWAAAPSYTREFAARVEATRPAQPRDFFSVQGDASSTDTQLLAVLCRGYLLQNGLAQGDRLAMANSVELRLPLVDYKLVELLVGLQKAQPLDKSKPKQLLRDAAEGLLPDYVARRPKRGFTPPVSRWTAALRGRYGRDLVEGCLVQDGVLDRRAAASLVGSANRFGTANDMFIKYLVLEFWLRGMRGETP